MVLRTALCSQPCPGGGCGPCGPAPLPRGRGGTNGKVLSQDKVRGGHGCHLGKGKYNQGPSHYHYLLYDRNHAANSRKMNRWPGIDESFWSKFKAFNLWGRAGRASALSLEPRMALSLGLPRGQSYPLGTLMPYSGFTVHTTEPTGHLTGKGICSERGTESIDVTWVFLDPGGRTARPAERGGGREDGGQ